MEKRLHLSGITPAISTQDISQRFASFGTVHRVDGVGQVDGNGQPRKFAYVTLETTQPKLTRCLNLLNGTTWKGTKLRVGEAKPDWKERLLIENGSLPAKRPGANDEQDTPPKKKKRVKKLPVGVGREVQDMKPTTLDNVIHRKTWKRTALDHLVRPMRMRPSHPLPPPISTLSSSRKLKSQSAKRKIRPPLVRARRTLIDPARYGAVHLTAASGFLGADFVGYPGPSQTTLKSTPSPPPPPSPPHKIKAKRTPLELPVHSERPKAVRFATASPPPAPTHLKEQVLNSQDIRPIQDAEVNLEQEKSLSLSILDALFVSEHDQPPTWEPDSDLEDEIAQVRAEEEKLKDDIPGVRRIVPGISVKNAMARVEQAQSTSSDSEFSDAEEPSESEESSGSEASQDDAEKNSVPIEGPAAQVQMTSLKDMFAPHEEEAGYSLFSSLNIDDLELDEEMAPVTQPSPTFSKTTAPPHPPVPDIIAASDLFDPMMPFFFLLPRDAETGLVDLPGGAAGRKGGRPKDIISVLHERGVPEFCRTETDEELRQRWDEKKGDLTREYKRRHREAIKKRRRGAGGNFDVDGF